MMEWISVADRLPDHDGEYLIVTKLYDKPYVVQSAFEASCNGLGHSWIKSSNGEVTHWMPLPEPPQA